MYNIKMANGNNSTYDQDCPVEYGTPIILSNSENTPPVGIPITLENTRSPLLHEIHESDD